MEKACFSLPSGEQRERVPGADGQRPSCKGGDFFAQRGSKEQRDEAAQVSGKIRPLQVQAKGWHNLFLHGRKSRP